MNNIDKDLINNELNNNQPNNAQKILDCYYRVENHNNMNDYYTTKLIKNIIVELINIELRKDINNFFNKINYDLYILLSIQNLSVKHLMLSSQNIIDLAVSETNNTDSSQQINIILSKIMNYLPNNIRDFIKYYNKVSLIKYISKDHNEPNESFKDHFLIDVDNNNLEFDFNLGNKQVEVIKIENINNLNNNNRPIIDLNNNNNNRPIIGLNNNNNNRRIIGLNNNNNNDRRIIGLNNNNNNDRRIIGLNNHNNNNNKNNQQ